jgi:hypothetical protein
MLPAAGGDSPKFKLHSVDIFCIIVRFSPKVSLSLRLAFFPLVFFFFSSWGDSPKLLNVAAWQLLNQLGSKILLRFLFVLGRRQAGFDCPYIWHSPIPV